MTESTLASSAETSCGSKTRTVKWTAAGGVLAALGVCVACCVLPFMLVGLGVGGAWVGSLEALVPYKPFFVAASAGLLGYGFYTVYLTPKPACGPSCQTCASRRTVQIWLWAGTALAIASLVLEPLVAGT